ncbi:MAG: lipopolysaccharide biosynthesis protein [Candidatus Hermodarchaeota archaeon]
MRKKRSFFLILLIALVFIEIAIVPVRADNSIDVLVVSSTIEEAMLDRLGLDPSFVITDQNNLPTNLNTYGCIVLFDYVPSSSEITALESYSGGIIIAAGPNTSNNASLLVVLGLSTAESGNVIASEALPVPNPQNRDHPIIQQIEWNSVPTIANYSHIPLSGTILLETSSITENPGLPLISTANNNQYLAINIWLDESLNTEFIQWPYFNYFMYLTLSLTSEGSILSYADWSYSPVPHLPETILLGLMVILVSGITVFSFFYARKRAREHPVTEEELEELAKEQKVEEEWEDIGFHRQLGGFLIQLFIALIFLLPSVIMTSLVLPLVILPSPQAVGFYDFTLRFFEALWLLFDLGTGTVLVKFFSEHRVKRPRYAIRFIQIFVWYQMVSGVIQLFLISFLGSIIFPRTFLAHMSWIFVTHSFFQWPAFYIVFMLIFQAMNRIDLYQIINLLLYAIFNVTLQYLVIIIFRVVLGPNVIFGDSLAGAIGYSVGNYVVRLGTFLISMWLFKRMGFSIKTIFRVDFGWQELKEAINFGVRWTIGNFLPPLGWLWQVFLLSVFLPNYTQQQGFFSLAWNFALIVMLVGLFAQSMLGAVSESYHAGRKKLTQYYAVASLKWAAFFDWFFVGALMALGPRFILGGAGLEWAGAAILLPWLLIFHAFGFFSWLGDWMFAGSDRPSWAAASWIIEQVLRGTLLLLLIPAYGFFSTMFQSPLVAVMFAYIPALIVKNIFMWWGIRRSDYFQFSWRDLIWQGFIVPLVSAVVLYSVLDILFSLIWQGDIITSVLILVVGTIPGLFFYSFVSGLLGGYDDNTLGELKRATTIAKGVRILTKPLYKVTEWGAKLSPLHNRFPISIFSEAAAEAASLTQEKEQLVI